MSRSAKMMWPLTCHRPFLVECPSLQSLPGPKPMKGLRLVVLCMKATLRDLSLVQVEPGLGLQIRHMNHMTVEAFYQIYLMWGQGSGVPEGEVASRTCFRDTYETNWKKTLKMRTVSQHARQLGVNIIAYIGPRCTQCAEFSARCRVTTTEEARAKLETLQRLHLNNVQQYRNIQSRLNVLSETSGSNILKIDMDGLDQNKTKFPRNLDSSKALANAWRPQLHLVAIIAWGVT